MIRRSRFDALMAKRRAVEVAEKAGDVSDSLSVRMELVERMNRGEMTLDQVQKELKSIKRKGKKEGKLTRAQVYSRA